jgi:hypothetical protein
MGGRKEWAIEHGRCQKLASSMEHAQLSESWWNTLSRLPIALHYFVGIHEVAFMNQSLPSIITLCSMYLQDLDDSRDRASRQP